MSDNVDRSRELRLRFDHWRATVREMMDRLDAIQTACVVAEEEQRPYVLVEELRNWGRTIAHSSSYTDRQTMDEIWATLAAGGEVLYPPGTPEYDKYVAAVTRAINDRD